MAMRVVSDTGPLHYLVLIEAIEILPALFGGVAIPEAVVAESKHPEAPAALREWVTRPPTWLSFASSPMSGDRNLDHLDLGERQAILLAKSMGADLLLMDDRAGRSVARTASMNVVGTLGVLDLASRRGMLDLTVCIERLQGTNFRCRPALLQQFLARARESRGAAPAPNL